jgi:AcrR family transcriptional regulator
MLVYNLDRVEVPLGKRKEPMPASVAVDDDRRTTASVRSRNANATKQQLIQAARRRFAYDGYDATTVRDIATDAGVNVALINRYFVSKEGLFEACITIAGEQLVRPDEPVVTVDQLARRIVSQLVGSASGDDLAKLQMLLLVRSSGDQRAESIRRGILNRYAEGMAAAIDGPTPRGDSDARALRAQIALSSCLGMVLLRTSSGLEPLSSASEAQLFAPLRDVLAAIFTP